MSTVQKIAEWIHSRDQGAICTDIATEFCVSKEQASKILTQIRREPRFTTRTEPCVFKNTRGAIVTGRRVYVDAITQPQLESKPIIATYRDGRSLQFDCISKAHRQGRFSRAMIGRCLRGEQKYHRGYSWAMAPAAHKDKGGNSEPRS